MYFIRTTVVNKNLTLDGRYAAINAYGFQIFTASDMHFAIEISPHGRTASVRLPRFEKLLYQLRSHHAAFSPLLMSNLSGNPVSVLYRSSCCIFPLFGREYARAVYDYRWCYRMITVFVTPSQSTW